VKGREGRPVEPQRRKNFCAWGPPSIFRSSPCTKKRKKEGGGGDALEKTKKEGVGGNNKKNPHWVKKMAARRGKERVCSQPKTPQRREEGGKWTRCQKG